MAFYHKGSFRLFVLPLRSSCHVTAQLPAQSLWRHFHETHEVAVIQLSKIYMFVPCLNVQVALYEYASTGSHTGYISFLFFVGIPFD